MILTISSNINRRKSTPNNLKQIGRTTVNQTQDILKSCVARAEQAFSNASNQAAARDAALYLAHTSEGEGIRKLADATGTHPSTVSRAVRRVEQQRDDPLFDRILTAAEGPVGAASANADHRPCVGGRTASPGGQELRREAKRYLRRLSEPGAFLLIAQATDKAGIFCSANNYSRPIALLPVDVAAEFLRKDWIKARTRGSNSVRYRITDVGRAWLRRVLAEEQAERAPGMAEAAAPFRAQHQEIGEKFFADRLTGEPEARKVNLGESPIGWLARRKGPDGKAFLTIEEVDAAEKLRTDFELAQIGPSVAQDWRKFLTPGDRLSGTPVAGAPGEGAMMARDRVMKALAALGPGLADVALRTCCFLEGLEACERRMGWSARSAKVVLKLALQRLADHYGLKVFKD